MDEAGLKISRRNFLLSLSAAAIGGLGASLYFRWPVLSKTNNAYLMSPSRAMLADMSGTAFSFLNLNNLEHTVVPLPLKSPHSVVGNPLRRSRVWVVEKFGDRICEVDLREKRLCRTVQANAGNTFYGHATYSASGKEFFTTEVNARGGGVIRVRNAEAMEPLEEFPAYGYAPHDLALLNNGKILVFTIADKAGFTAVHAVDIQSKKLLFKIETAKREQQLNHIAVFRDQIASCINTMKSEAEIKKLAANPNLDLEKAKFGSAPIILGGLNQGQFEAEFPQREFLTMQGQRYISINPQTEILAAANNIGSLVGFWHLQTGKFVTALNTGQAALSGIVAVPNSDNFAVFFVDSSIKLISSISYSQKHVPAQLIGADHYFSWIA